MLTILFFAALRLLRLDMRTYLAPLIFDDTGNIGLPLAFFAFAEVGPGYALIEFAIMAI